MMRGDSYRSLLLAVAVMGLGVSMACKSAQPVAEAPTTKPPVFDAAKPAEKVDESSGFKEANTGGESLGEGGSSQADTLNAQNVLKRIHFDFDKADIRSEDMPLLSDNAARIKQNSGLAVRIEGHCDERGTVEYNLALGDHRARAARDYLVSLGLPATRLRTISYGKEKPLDAGHSESAWAANRRAEFSFIAE